MRSVIKSAKTVDEAIELALVDLGLSRVEIEYEVLEEAKSGFLGIFGSKDAIVKVSEKEDFKIDINDIYGEKARIAEEEKKALEAKKAEEERKALEAKKAEEERKTLEAKKAEEERKALEAKKAEEERKVLEAKKADEKAQVESFIDKDFDNDEADEVEAVRGQDKVKVEPKVLLETVKKDLEQILEMMHIKAKVEAFLGDESLDFNLVDISEEDTGIIIGRKGETLDSLQYILSLLANKATSDFVRVSLNVANYRSRRKEAIENNARKVAFKVIKTKRSIALDPMNSYERRIVHYALQKYKEVETVSQGSFPNRKVIIKYKD